MNKAHTIGYEEDLWVLSIVYYPVGKNCWGNNKKKKEEKDEEESKQTREETLVDSPEPT
jgi:hypothetical protein